MVIVDTSFCILALRSSKCREALILQSLLEADEVALAVPVRTELLMGARQADRPALERGLAGLPMLYPTDATWKTIDRWTAQASRGGQTFAIGDLLIGAVTAEIGGLVWSIDGDFARMEDLKLIERYVA